jgi:hypothetical protein
MKSLLRGYPQFEALSLRWTLIGASRLLHRMLRYTNLDEAIRLARLAGMSTIETVRALSGSVPHAEALKIARKAAPISGIALKEFMVPRRNW